VTTGIYLRKGLTYDSYSVDMDFSFCQSTPEPAAPMKKCETYYYSTDNWLD
jgi:hypothetical protein